MGYFFSILIIKKGLSEDKPVKYKEKFTKNYMLKSQSLLTPQL